MLSLKLTAKASTVRIVDVFVFVVFIVFRM
mgnify:CR=1 FL=1